MRVALKIVPDVRSSHPANAWFIAKNDSRQWLAEMERWDVPLDGLKVRLVPGSNVDRTALGVLVTADGNQRGHASVKSISPCGGKASLPYRRIAGRLFVPVDSAIVPPVDDDELKKLFPVGDDEFVWHPAAGLIRIESADQLRLVDLLQAPTQRSAAWDRAVSGTAFGTRLISIEPESSLTLEEILKQAAEEIGTKRAALDQLPPTPDELLGGKLNQWTKPLRDAFRALKKWSEKKAAERTPPPPPTNKSGASGGNPSTTGNAGRAFSAVTGLIGQGLGFALSPLIAAGAAAGMVASSLAALPFIDQLARNREIDRLMHLLKTDPDAGLKFALPMGGSGAPRGIAAPSNQLMSRDIGFSLGRLGRGGPTDIWDLAPDQQFQLIQQYRELAMREIRLGRHRRAAYIYAELLNDLNAAAAALENGQHYREAAVLYRDRLNRPVDAAKCLERAGLLDEAASIFVDEGMFERAAELYVRLGRPEEAERLLRSFADQLISNGDFRNASRIFHDKLDDVDAALATLELAWPSSPMALACLDESFAMMGLHARHESATNRIADLRDSQVDGASTRLLARGLSTVFANYPDRTVKDAAADATQIVVARALPRAKPSESNELLASIRRLAPQDKLLGRDCDRFVQNQQTALRVKAKALSAKKISRGIEEVESCWMQLKGPTWHAAKSAGKSIYVAGFEQGSLVLQRLEWDQPGVKRSPAIWSGVSSARRLILEPYPGDAGDVILHPVGIGSIGKRGLPTGRGTMISAGTPTWATLSTLALAYEPNGYGWRIREDFGSLVLGCFSPQGEPLIVKDLETRTLPESIDDVPMTLWAASGRVRIGIGSHLCRPNLETAKNPSVVFASVEKLEDNIQTLIGASIGSETWLCALFENDAMLIDDADHSVRIRIAEGLQSPCGVFLPSGLLVVAGGGEVQAYHLMNSRPKLIGRCQVDGRPIGVTATDRVGQFALITDEGAIKIFSVTLNVR